MPSNISRIHIPSAKTALALFTMATATCLGSLPARAVSCEDVRNLTTAEQEYWAKRLNLTSEQRHRIWAACYKDYHPQHPRQDEVMLR